jgi:hypothetical protein
MEKPNRRGAETPAQEHERELAELAELVSRDARDVARVGCSPLNDGTTRYALSALRQHVDLLASKAWKPARPAPQAAETGPVAEPEAEL